MQKPPDPVFVVLETEGNDEEEWNERKKDGPFGESQTPETWTGWGRDGGSSHDSLPAVDDGGVEQEGTETQDGRQACKAVEPRQDGAGLEGKRQGEENDHAQSETEIDHGDASVRIEVVHGKDANQRKADGGYDAAKHADLGPGAGEDQPE